MAFTSLLAAGGRSQDSKWHSDRTTEKRGYSAIES